MSSWFGGMFSKKPVLPTTAPTQAPPKGTNKEGENYTVVPVKPYEVQASTKTNEQAAINAAKSWEPCPAGCVPKQGGGRRTAKGKGRKTKGRGRKTKGKGKKRSTRK